MNFDRFLDKFDESTLVTMKRHYWTAKQLLRTKLGKKEDEHLLASDASLDSKLTLFRSVRDTSENLLACVENYQAYLLGEVLLREFPFHIARISLCHLHSDSSFPIRLGFELLRFVFHFARMCFLTLSIASFQ
ncbi:hypothetical protein OESDEN_10394 [Oesophagostomum dentatum]|uniref:AH domain-containing protein n=1 Tax=Oesophagostomum dentatum TaxID=61180 RepID=A0A0B1T1W1_OESDE|nr:hypothetical protein OESDEN_10394 [Oesophagostomum dentatum]